MSKLIRLLIVGILFISVRGLASPQYDISTLSPLDPSVVVANYTFRISDCTSLKSVSIPIGGATQTFSASEAQRLSKSSVPCSYSFSTAGAQLFSSRVVVNDVNGGSESYSELFYSESEKPSLELLGINIATIEGKQYLKASFEASDNNDLSYLSVRLAGIKASDLRASLGESSSEDATSKGQTLAKEKVKSFTVLNEIIDNTPELLDGVIGDIMTEYVATP